MATHRFHTNTNAYPYGIQQTELVRGHHLTENRDPLNTGRVDEEKALASIPSMFARPRFIETAFTHCEFNGEQVSTYDKVVSKTLDLMESIFHSKDEDYRFDPFVFKDQMDSLNNSDHEGHKLLATVFDREQKYMGNVGTIFLIVNNDGKIEGGTSPFSLVYPSPDFIGKDEVRGLTSRSESFRLYMYRYYCAVLQRNNANTPFWRFVRFAMDADADRLDNQPKPVPGNYNFNNLKSDYDGITTDYGGQKVSVVSDNQIPLLRVKPTAFTSQLYIAATREEERTAFDRTKTPIILPSQDAGNFVCGHSSYRAIELRNKEKWNAKNDSEPRTIPGQTAKHPWVSAIDFFEDNLLVYPASINKEAFIGVHELDADHYVLPPLRTLFFKYFNIDDIKNDKSVKSMLELEYKKATNGKEIVVSLRIPVCDENMISQGTVVIFKNYAIPQIEEASFNVAISPFCNIKENPVLNTYNIMMLHTTKCKDSSKQKLSFYQDNKFIDGNPVERTPLSGNVEGTTFYNVSDFNNIEIEINESKGRLIPWFIPNKKEDNEYKYSIDFGTTNTNVAFKTIGAAENFNEEILKEQVQYLSTSDEEAVIAKLQFIPLDGVAYPIRTVMGSTKSNSESVSSLFGDSSIGFYYQKGILGDDDKIKYLPDLKWKMFRVDDESKGRGTLFMMEMLWLIKNHWMMHDHAAREKGKCPRIVFTFPNTDSEEKMKRKWRPLYEQIFGVSDNESRDGISTIPESLAPCMLEDITDDGFLNIDIGGGTTDIQYRKGEKCLYNSILFAADDIWGDGYEHVEIKRLKEIATKNRAGNRYRDLSDKNELTRGKLDKNMETRELLSFLFKNKIELVENYIAISKNEDGESNSERRKPLFLHFAALMYHITKWLQANTDGDFPIKIKFTGMGSGYVKWLVGKDENLTSLVKGLISKYGDGKISNIDRITVATEEDVIEAKRKTSKGALGVFNDEEVPNNSSKIFIGIKDDKVDSSKCKSIDSFKDSYWPQVEEALKGCITGYNEVASSINNDNDNTTFSCPILSWDKIAKCAEDSFRNMSNVYKTELAERGVKDSLFVWALKNSLWQI